MCIRDRTVSDINEKKVHSKGVIDKSKPNLNTQLKTKYVVPVSYTHLTLPTSDLV